MIIGAQILGHASPNFQDFATARGAAGEIYDTIDRVSVCVCLYVRTCMHVCVCACACVCVSCNIRLPYSSVARIYCQV